METVGVDSLIPAKTKAAVSLACETCRRRKIKCSGKPAPCASCKQFKTECIFPAGPKSRRAPIRSSRRIDGLEDRLSRIEALLKSSVNRAKVADAPSVAPASHKEELPSRHGSNRANVEKGTSAERIVTGLNSPLPSLSEATKLANKYFAAHNRFLPLFDEHSFMESVRDKYSTLESGDPVLWAAVNVVFALSHQSTAAHLVPDELDHHMLALGFVRNTMSVVDQLSARESTMLSAQTLLGIAKVWQATSTPQTSTFYLAMAIRQIYQLGLHKATSQAEMEGGVLEWSRRLLWQAYIADKDFSLRQDQPHMLNDDDIDMDLPAWNPNDNLGYLPANDETLRMNYLRLNVNLAIVQSKTYTRLYSRQSLRQPQTDLAKNAEGVCDLVSMLLAWKSQIPLEFDAITFHKALPQPSIVAMVILYVRYFNCLTMLHRLSFWKVGHLEAYKASFENITINPCPSHGLCIEAARVSLRLFSVLPQGNVPCMWLLNDCFVSAVVILLAAIIYDSFLSLGWQDLQLVEPLVAHLAVLSRHGDTERLEHIHSNCVELVRAATKLLSSPDAIEDYNYPEALVTAHNNLDSDWLYVDGV